MAFNDLKLISRTSENADFSDPEFTTNWDPFALTGVIADLRLMVVDIAPFTIDLSVYTSISYIAIKNTSLSLGVNVTHKTSVSAPTITVLPAGALMVLPDVVIANNLILSDVGGIVTVKVLIVGVGQS